MPECKASQLDHGESIHLANRFSVRINQKCSTQNFFHHSLANAIGAANLGIDGALDVFRTYRELSGLACPLVRFAQQVSKSSAVR